MADFMTNRLMILVLGIVPGLAAASESAPTFFSRAESFSYSGANPVTAFIDLLAGPAPKSGENAFSRNSIELGVAHKGLEFSVIHRNDYNLSFTSDGAELAYRSTNAIPIPLDREYDVEVWANQYQVTGARIGYSFPVDDSFSLSIGYSQLYATEAVSGYLGKAEDGSGGIVKVVRRELAGEQHLMLDGDLYADYFYTSDPLFARDVSAPTGQGYAVDLGFQWRPLEGLLIEGKMDDVAGELRWYDLPRTTATATSETIVVDDDGFLKAYPNFAGTETEDNFRQDLTRRERLLIHYQTQHFYLGYEYDRMSLANFYWLRAGYRWTDQWGVRLGLEAGSGATEFSFLIPVGELSLTVDDFDLDHAHILGVKWNIHIPM